MTIIYKITSPTNRIYIGQTKNFTKRKHDYKRLNCKQQRFIYKSLKKYGFDNHKFEIIDRVNDNEANDKEIYYISYYNSYSLYNKKGMNLTLGGMNYPKSEEHKKKISKSLLGKNNIQSKKFYQFDLEGNFIKRWDSIREIERILGYFGAALILSVKENRPSYGYVWSYNKNFPIIRDKKDTLSKKIYVYSKNKKLLYTFNSINDTAKALKVHRLTISRNLNKNVTSRKYIITEKQF